MVAEVLSLNVGVMIEDGFSLPIPSTPDQARKKDLAEDKKEGYKLANGVL